MKKSTAEELGPEKFMGILIMLYLSKTGTTYIKTRDNLFTSLTQYVPFLKVCFKTFSFCIAKQNNVKK